MPLLQFQSHPVMIEVLAVQKYPFADYPFNHKPFAQVEGDGAMVIRSGMQVDLRNDLCSPGPVDERIELKFRQRSQTSVSD